MKRAIYLGLCNAVLMSGMLVCQQSEYSFQLPLPPQKGIIVNIVNDVKNDNNHVITQKNMMHMGMPTSSTLSGYIPGNRHTPALTDLAQAAFALCLAHKGTIIVGSLIGAYGFLVTKLYIMEKRIAKYGFWGTWHNEVSLANLQHYDPQQLAHELFSAMKMRYLPANYSHDDFLVPLVEFSNECKHERELIDLFLQFRSLLCKTKLMAIVPAQTVAIAQAQDRLERLSFLQSHMLTWLTEYSLQTKQTT